MELVDRVVALYEELAMVTAAFLAAIEDGPPDEATQTLFWSARTDLVGRLQPLLAQEGDWLGHGDGYRQALALQVQKMERVSALDAQVSFRLAVWQAEVDAELKSLGQGKKGLVGYRVGLKPAPRFCKVAA